MPLKKCLRLLLMFAAVLTFTACDDDDNNSEFVFPTPSEMTASGNYLYPTLDGRIAKLTAPIKNAYFVSTSDFSAEPLIQKGIPIKTIHFNGETRHNDQPYYLKWLLIELTDDCGIDITELRKLTSDLQMWVAPVFGKSIAYAKCATPFLIIRFKEGCEDQVNAFQEAHMYKLRKFDNDWMLEVPYDTDALTSANEYLKLDFVESVEPIFCDTWGRLHNFAYPL